jgi:hypothetical protein
MDIETDLISVLLSNCSVNKPQQQTVFYWVRAATVAMQWFGKHVPTIEAVFSVGSAQRSYFKNSKYGRESQGTRTRERLRCQGPTAKTRP